MNLDRFSPGLPDPQEKEPEVISTCTCNQEIYGWDLIYEFDGDMYCSSDCLANAVGARYGNADDLKSTDS